MTRDPAGQRGLHQTAQRLDLPEMRRLVRADNRDYVSYPQFFQADPGAA